MKLRQDDKLFSQYIRKRDKRCLRCGSPIQFNEKGNPITHQVSHYFGRSRENTRIDPDNCDTLCFGCHKIWGSDDKEGYRNFMIKKLGEYKFKLLELHANLYKKKDIEMNLIIIKELLKDNK